MPGGDEKKKQNSTIAHLRHVRNTLEMRYIQVCLLYARCMSLYICAIPDTFGLKRFFKHA